MGYSTEFKGELKFTRELKSSEIVKLRKILNEDCRDHPEWESGRGLTYIDTVPDFWLTVVMEAQGDDMDDRWLLVIGEDGFATKKPVPPIGGRVTCPDCGCKFIPGDK